MVLLKDNGDMKTGCAWLTALIGENGDIWRENRELRTEREHKEKVGQLLPRLPID